MGVESELRMLADPERARALSRFFKIGKGEYGEGDVFLGIRVPDIRKVAKRYGDLPLSDIKKLLMSKYHEHRLAGLLILVERYQKGDEEERIFRFYLRNTSRINNWDLVDLSAHKIVGEHLQARDRGSLYKLARSENLWERRIAVIATFSFIRRGDFKDSFRIAGILLHDEHDLIHKAVGWMLREVGKRDQDAEERFLKKHCKEMPRTMLRYAIERFDERKKGYYMA